RPIRRCRGKTSWTTSIEPPSKMPCANSVSYEPESRRSREYRSFRYDRRTRLSVNHLAARGCLPETGHLAEISVSNSVRTRDGSDKRLSCSTKSRHSAPLPVRALRHVSKIHQTEDCSHRRRTDRARRDHVVAVDDH